MKNFIRFIGCFLIAQGFVLGISLTEKTRDLEPKVALSFGLFLVGIFILILVKDEFNRT